MSEETKKTTKQSSMMMPVAVAVTAVIVGAASFFGGIKYQQTKQLQFGGFNRQFGSGQFAGRGGMMGGNTQSGQGGTRMGMGFRPVNGEIISADDKSITVKLIDGSSKIVLFSDKTSINKADEAKKEDLKSGEKVAVFGQENPDGSINAQSIQLNPVLRMMTNEASPSTQQK